MKCPFCDSTIIKKPLKKKSIILKNKVNYYSCKNCSSIFQYPYPDDRHIHRYYDSYYSKKKIMNPGYLDEKNISNLFNERDKTLKEIGFQKKWLKKGNNVEFGCANGQFLKYLVKNDAKKIIGIDISKNLIKSIKLKKIKLYTGDLSIVEYNSTENLFLFNILEHITDINLLFDKIKKIIKKKGRIVIEVPLCGIISKFFSNKWRFLMPDEHLNIPSLKGIVIFLKKHGFKIIGKTRFGSGFTSGSINNNLKKLLDFLVKRIAIGDRGAFLVINND